MKARTHSGLAVLLLLLVPLCGHRTAWAYGGGCRPLPTVMMMAGKAAPWKEQSTGEHVLDEATMVALCLGHDLARLVTLAVQVENSCSVRCTLEEGNVYHVNITDGLSCGVEKVCIRTECRRQPSVTESDLCKTVHPNQASQASGYDECQFLCYVRNQDTPFRYCRPPGTACTKWESGNVQCPRLLHEQRVKASEEGANKGLSAQLAFQTSSPSFHGATSRRPFTALGKKCLPMGVSLISTIWIIFSYLSLSPYLRLF